MQGSAESLTDDGVTTALWAVYGYFYCQSRLAQVENEEIFQKTFQESEGYSRLWKGWSTKSRDLLIMLIIKSKQGRPSKKTWRCFLLEKQRSCTLEGSCTLYNVVGKVLEKRHQRFGREGG